MIAKGCAGGTIQKYLLIIFVASIMFVSGCKYQQEYYNQRDAEDFRNGTAIKFRICELQQIMDKSTIKKSGISGGFFLFAGGFTGKSTEETKLVFNYYLWLESMRGATYFFVIPSNVVAIYQDAEPGEAWVIGGAGNYAGSNAKLSLDRENNILQYYRFNFHVPPGTIIMENIDLIGIDKWMRRQ